MAINLDTYFTFDDVLLQPQYSEILPKQVSIATKISRNVELNVPIISAAMDTVTESRLAITMAQNGAIGCIHKNMTVTQQKNEVIKVKKYESGIVHNPITLAPDATVSSALSLMKKHGISGIPVVANDQKLKGILTNRDVRFCADTTLKVKELMTSENLVTITEGVGKKEAKELLHKNKIEKLLVVDEDYNCVGLLTVKDMENAKKHPLAVKDKLGRLRVAAAVGIGKDSEERVEALVEAKADIIIVDTAHGDSKGVIDMVKYIKKNYTDVDVIAGNIATAEAAKRLHDAGVDAVKLGIGPGSICTTRIIAGVGVPQLSAIIKVSKICKELDLPLISDGGIKYSGDLAKALAAGASCVMLGGLLAGCKETPGEIILFKGRSYKYYRGMGSLGAMARGSADRYFQEDVDSEYKLVPEGVEGRVPYKGQAADVIYQLVGGLKSSMGYCGAKDLDDFHNKAKFIKISQSGLFESHPHNIDITREAPNYGVSK
jgi:IMP dehydrogenase